MKNDITERNRDSLKVKKNFVLIEMGDSYMVVPVGPATREFSGFIRLNDSGAFLWKELEKGATEEELADALLGRYPDADRKHVQEDVREFLETVAKVIDP